MANIVEELEVPSGHTLRKVIRCARQGTVSKCRLVQWDDDEGLHDGFKFSFWSAKEACPPGVYAEVPFGQEPPEGASVAPDKWDRMEYRLAPAKEVEKGKDEARDEDGEPDVEAGWGYKNCDNGGSQTNMLRQIYLELVDGGPLDPGKVKRYKLYLTVEAKSAS